MQWYINLHRSCFYMNSEVYWPSHNSWECTHKCLWGREGSGGCWTQRGCDFPWKWEKWCVGPKMCSWYWNLWLHTLSVDHSYSQHSAQVFSKTYIRRKLLSVLNQNNSICAAVAVSRAGCSLRAEGWPRLWAVLQGKWCSVFLRSGRALPVVPEQGSQQNSSPAQPPAQCAQLCRCDLNLHHERDLLWGRKYGLWRSKSFLA